MHSFKEKKAYYAKTKIFDIEAFFLSSNREKPSLYLEQKQNKNKNKNKNHFVFLY